MTVPAENRRDQRTLDRIFGDVLPETSSDERTPGDDPDRGDADRDRWYEENRPPHHG